MFFSNQEVMALRMFLNTIDSLMLRLKPNVCVDERNEPVQEDEFSDFSGNGRDVSENCKGNDEKYVCVSRISENGQTTRNVKTYQCCPGFVRPTDGGAGCVGEK
ncbi:UNVERIFIED_CONTAM: hypothetical protein NCL1_34452 [Trichonephila clavipes]